MIRVIGIGSPFGDDRAAWEVIAGLESHRRHGLDLLTLNQPGASLINWFEGVERLILVDTLLAEGSTAPFLRIEQDDLLPGHAALSSHGQQLRETLDLAAALGCLPAETEVYAVVLTHVDPAVLNPAAVRAARALAAHLAVRIETPECMAGPAGRPQDRSN